MGKLRAQWKKNPGFVVSGGAHVLALVLLLANFSRAPKIADAIEAVPVEMISTSDLNEITKGEKTAKPMPKPQLRVDKVAELEEPKPLPPTLDAKKDTPPLPSPDKANDDPGHDEKPPEPVSALPPPRPADPTPPTPPVPTPPERPVEKPVEKAETPPVPTPPERPTEKADSKPDEDKPDAEAIAPKPPPRPKQPVKEAKAEPPKPEPKPVPVPRARPVEKKIAKLEPPLPPKHPDTKPDPKSSMLDDVSKLLDKMKPPKPVTKQRSGNEVKEAKSHDDFSLDKISALLDHEAPQRKASTGRALTQMASLGLPTAHADKMSPALQAQIDGWFIDHYNACWHYFGLAGAGGYVPHVKVVVNPDGSLLSKPSLTNPTSDPNLRSLADSALRAVQECDPLPIPDWIKPHYAMWRSHVINFDVSNKT